MVYDCFSFFNELDLLEIRLNTLDHVVDQFVLVEATKTHSNKDKPLFFWENRERYARFLSRIVYIKVDDYPPFVNSWTYENHQRNMIMEGLRGCKDDDIILISDLDEIPNPEAIQRYDGSGIFTLEQETYTCFINYKSLIFRKWYGTNIMRYRDINDKVLENHSYRYSNTFLESINKGATPTKIRFIRDFPIIKKGGWHFTYLGGVEQIKYKLDSFGHQEVNNPEYNSEEVIRKKLRKGLDLINPKDNRCVPVRIGKGFPPYLVANIGRYPALVCPITWATPFRNAFIVVSTLARFYLIRYPRKIAKRVLKGRFTR